MDQTETGKLGKIYQDSTREDCETSRSQELEREIPSSSSIPRQAAWDYDEITRTERSWESSCLCREQTSRSFELWYSFVSWILGLIQYLFRRALPQG